MYARSQSRHLEPRSECCLLYIPHFHCICCSAGGVVPWYSDWGRFAAPLLGNSVAPGMGRWLDVRATAVRALVYEVGFMPGVCDTGRAQYVGVVESGWNGT